MLYNIIILRILYHVHLSSLRLVVKGCFLSNLNLMHHWIGIRLNYWLLGIRQEYGIEYRETFTPITKNDNCSYISSYCSFSSWLIHQMDVKNAFLHGDLKEGIYMRPSLGLLTSNTTILRRLKRSVYGLKLAPRASFEKFRRTLSLSLFCA